MNLRDQISQLTIDTENDPYDEGIKGHNEALENVIKLIDKNTNLRTVTDVANQIYPGITYDTALPQSWVNTMADRGFDVRGHFVTLYPKDSVAYMAPITDQGIRIAAVVASTVR
jgi:hypothetical protein